MIKTYKGSAITITVLAIAAMTTLIVGVAQLVPRDFRQSLALESSLSAESAAWGGVEQALYLLKYNQAKNDFFELTAAPDSPSGYYSPPTQANNDCEANRAVCPGLDRQLGAPHNQTPVTLKLFGSDDTYYRLLVWHKRQNIGNTNPSVGLDDGLDAALNAFRIAPNINGLLDRDEVRRLDASGITSTLTLTWKPIIHTGCDAEGQSANLLVTWLNKQGEILDRQLLIYPADATNRVLSKPAESHLMSLRLLLRNATDESRIRDCFARYSIQNEEGDTSDLGFDVIESTGVSGPVKRKIRVIVNRENGRLLNIFDFGLACEDCINIDDY